MTIKSNLNTVHRNIIDAKFKYNRKLGEVQCVAVSKTRSSADIRDAVGAGQRLFGENYLQEALSKMQSLHDLDIEWHFIGPIQSNKTKFIAENFAWVHSVDRLKVAQRLNDQRPIDLPPLNVCIEVNVSGEQTKSGVALVELAALAGQVAAMPNLTLRGLMAIPKTQTEFALQRAPFKILADALADLNTQGLNCDTLSMGMSGDYQAAIAEGATLVRIGTAIFGPRDNKE